MKPFTIFSNSLKAKVTSAVVGMLILALSITCVLIFGALHKSMVEDSKTIMTGIATGRKKALDDWFATCWDGLHIASEEVSEKLSNSASNEHLMASLLFIQDGTEDFSELFVVDKSGSVLASTYEPNLGKDLSEARYIKAGLGGENFLEGPYIDEVTKEIGGSSSSFLDAVTLMFAQPVKDRSGETIAVLCGRVPNDAMADMLQDESSHIYKGSGDNYLFMVESSTGIEQGASISRSRFEDDSIVKGHNLKDGVPTEQWGVVQVEKHTEFEMHFIDPASGEFTVGVENTIRKKQYVNTWPGYPDYRHIMVAGKSLTIKPRYSPDTWGLMCEADISEIYRNLMLARNYAMIIGGTLVFVFGLLNFFLLNSLVIKPINAVNSMVQDIAEGEGDLTKRLEIKTNDEIGTLCMGFNKFLEKLDHIIASAIHSMGTMGAIRYALAKVAEETNISSEGLEIEVTTSSSAIEEISRNIQEVAKNVEVQSAAVNETSAAANEMSASIKEVANFAEKANESSQQAMSVAIEGDATVKEALSAMKAISESSSKINEIIDVITSIADQTNLLALNAAIEAARAGEAGKGFAVVAEEVRNLAEQSGKAAKEITGLIKDSTIKAEKGVQLTNKLADVIKKSHESVKIIASLNQHIGTATIEQTNAAEEVAKAMENINQITHEITAATEEQSDATNQLAKSMEHALSVAQQNKAGATDAIDNVRELVNHGNKLDELMNVFKVNKFEDINDTAKISNDTVKLINNTAKLTNNTGRYIESSS